MLAATIAAAKPPVFWQPADQRGQFSTYAFFEPALPAMLGGRRPPLSVFTTFFLSEPMSTLAASEIDRRTLMPIGIRTLSASTVLGFRSLYPERQIRRNVSLSPASYPFGQDDIDRLAGAASECFVHFVGRFAGLSRLCARQHPEERKHSAAERYQALREATRDVFSEMLNGGDAASPRWQPRAS